MPDRVAASLAFASAFMSATAEDRATIVWKWNFGVEWAYPSPWRLACTKGEQGSPEQRIVASLVLTGLDTREDSREEIVSLGTAYNACVLAGLDPDAIFLRVAAALPERAASSLRNFAARLPEEKSLKAFLMALKTVDGESELYSTW